MADDARKWTDRRLNVITNSLSKEYSQAERELTKKWNDYMAKAQKHLEKVQKDYLDALKVGDNEVIDKMKKRLQDAQNAYTLQNARYQEMVDSFTKDLAELNQQALDHINGELPRIYAENYEQVTDSLGGTSFSLVDKSTIMGMAERGDVKSPFMRTERYLDIPKDQRWNKKKINSAVMQGILQGESMDKIANRIYKVIDANKASAMRNARTLVTGAENSGRLDSYKDLEEQGAVLKKVWIATADDRTREWHLDMDGQEVDLDEPFVDGNDNELDYPGDPNGEPETVYNCRCSMRTHIIGFRKDDGSISYVDFEHEKGLHHQQIEEEQERREEQRKEKQELDFQVVDGKDISETWERRPDEFDFAIEDIINAQGFDGLPRVVSKEEFDKAVKESNFIAQRTYSAPDQETLDMYRDQLYNGEFYVDCSGGSRLGRGMYCAANYNGELTDGLRHEISNYAKGEFNAIETFTLAKDAKIINYHDIYQMKNDFVNSLPASERRMYRKMDVGAFAALKGYDAIMEDASGGVSYTVILNRTKVIFLGK